MNVRPNLCLAAACLLACAPARAEEGMWLFTDPPRAQLKTAHRFELTQAWLDHVMTP